jgi:hypothetical protein
MIADISSQLAENGLILRGGFAFDDDEALPAGIAGTRAILLVGHGGPSIWLHFQAWLAGQPRRAAETVAARHPDAS